jgi:predicted phosphodiesterase
LDINRRQDESSFEHKKRLCIAKLDKIIDLDWSEIIDILKLECSADHLRKLSYAYKEVDEYLKTKREETISDDRILAEYELKRIEFEKEKQKFFDQRSAYKKLLRDSTRKEEDLDIMKNLMLKGNSKNLDYTPSRIEHSDNDLLVSLNDLHFGADIKNAWNVYNSDICRERLNKYLDKIFQFQSLHKSENCYVTANGDLINGNIHTSVMMSNKENIIEQVMGVSECIAQFLAELGKRFNNVHFTLVAGNHSRLGTKDDSLKNERLDSLIPWYIQARLQNCSNITYNENLDSTMSVFNIRGKNYLNVHGDYDSGKSAKRACALMTGEDIYAINCGHLHHNATDYVDNIKILMAGSLLGMDDFCISKRIIGIPQQMVCVCDKDGVKSVCDVNF